jgi:hypothetical protein
LSAEFGESVFGDVVDRQLKGAGDELERAAAWELVAKQADRLLSPS